MDASSAAVASRLCTACGMCCDGTLFEIVKLQSSDSIAALERLGMSLRRKKRAPYFAQPCSFLHDGVCGIYEQRPLRCRAFVCKQLSRVLEDGATETEAHALVQEAHQLARQVRQQLALVGDESHHLPLAERCRAHAETTAAAWSRLHEHLQEHFYHDEPSPESS